MFPDTCEPTTLHSFVTLTMHSVVSVNLFKLKRRSKLGISVGFMVVHNLASNVHEVRRQEARA